MKRPIFLILCLLILVFIGLLIWCVSALRNPHDRTPSTIMLISSDGTLLTKIPNEYGWFQGYTGSIENEFMRGLLLIEDKRFDSHYGIDVLGKLSALRQNLSEGSIVRGGSTLTEQYIKNRYFPGSYRTYLQKGKEGLLAFYLSLTRDKENVLRSYLDSLYFGNRIYGVKTAIETYFSKRDLADLSKDEIQSLLALIKYPTSTPGEDITWKNYKEQVGRRLGWTSQAFTGMFASPKKTNIYPLLTKRIEKEWSLYCDSKPNVLETFLLDKNTLSCEGRYPLTLSINTKLQDFATNSVRSLLAPLTEENVTNGAVYIYDPEDKKVIAYVANRSERGDGSEIDIITHRRSVGSLLKPFLYLEALRRGAEIYSLIIDEEKIYSTEFQGKDYIPLNYNLRSYGPVRLREALGNSLNIGAVRVTETLGLDTVYEVFKSNGLDLEHESSYYGYGLVLGGAELTLENVVRSFENLLDTTDPDKFLLSKILENPSNRSWSFGISSILNTSISMAVKTGTSSEFRDNWTVSYHPDAIIGVWVGNLDNSSMIGITGVTGAGPIWHNIAEYMIKNGLIRYKSIPIPKGVTASYECLDTPCLREEQTYKKDDKPFKSRILERRFYRSDFFTPPNKEEVQKWSILDN